jgi:hypothetical protein
MVLKTIAAICADLEKTSDATEKSIAGPVMRVSRDKYRVPLPASDIVQAAVAREVQTIQ